MIPILDNEHIANTLNYTDYSSRLRIVHLRWMVVDSVRMQVPLCRYVLLLAFLTSILLKLLSEMLFNDSENITLSLLLLLRVLLHLPQISLLKVSCCFRLLGRWTGDGIEGDRRQMERGDVAQGDDFYTCNDSDEKFK